MKNKNEIRHSILKNGLNIISVERPSELVTLQVAANVGSRDESNSYPGIAHFLEHNLFNGTATRNHEDIFNTIDNIGGRINGCTTINKTWYYTDTAGEDIETGMDVLADMLQNYAFREADIEKERGIVKQEIRNSLDNKEKKAFWNKILAAYNNPALKAKNIGSEADIDALDRSKLLDFAQQFYTTKNLYIAAAGNISHEKLVTLVEKYFDRLPEQLRPQRQKLNYTGGFRQLEEKTDSMILSISFEAGDISFNPAYEFLQRILGGHGRLFKEIREKHSLTYSVGTDSSYLIDNALFSMRATSHQKNANKILELMIAEAKKFCAEGPTNEEMERAKKLLQTSMLRSVEDNSSCATTMVNHLIGLQRIITPQEYIEAVNAVTAELVRAEAERIFRTVPTYAVYGTFDKIIPYDKIREMLK